MDHKTDNPLICECCLRPFYNSALFVHIDQHGKNKNSECWNFYLEKYKDRKFFPYRLITKTSIKHQSHNLQCEFCHKEFKQLYRHLSQYSDICLNHYKCKYGNNTNNWPEGSTKIACCQDCGNELDDHRAVFCFKCSSKNPAVIRKQKQIETKVGVALKKYYNDNPEAKLLISKRRKKYYQEKPHVKEYIRQYMLNGGGSLALSHSENPSRPQLILFDLVKQIFPNAVLNYRLSKINKVLDIAVPEIQLDIEYDGSYWHQDIESDQRRELLIRSLGWSIIRYRDRIPTIDELKKDSREEILFDWNGITAL